MPRCVLPGTTYHVIRRCLLQQFLLRPSSLVNQLILFCLAVAALRFGIELHAVCVMSNHYHFILTDHDARLPEFERWLDATIARALNRLRGRRESVWASGSYTAVRLEDEEAMVGTCAYVLANPVAAGLVREGHQWPGVRLGPMHTRTVRRPHFFFRDLGPLPPTGRLLLSVPPCFQDNPDDFVDRVKDATAALEEKARREAALTGRGFVGRRAVLAQRPTGSPTTCVSTPKRGAFAACRSRRRRTVPALERLRAFVIAYRSARTRFLRGERDVVFPAGTYALRIHYEVRCASP